MDWTLTIEILIKLSVSLVLGSLVGLEREWSKHPAGLRTHVLVSLGSTTFMMIGFYGSEIVSDSANIIDPTRMAAGIVTGIGFLGAGAIMKEGVNIRGLTTAATIWVVAAIGLCIAVELYAAGFITTFLSLVVLVVFSQVERKIGTKEFHGHLLIVGESFKGIPAKVAKILETYVAVLAKDYMASTTAGDMSASSEEQHVEQALKTFSKTTLHGARIIDHWTDPADGSLFALCELDLLAFKSALDEYKELDAKVRDYVRRNAEKLHQQLEREEEKR